MASQKSCKVCRLWEIKLGLNREPPPDLHLDRNSPKLWHRWCWLSQCLTSKSWLKKQQSWAGRSNLQPIISCEKAKVLEPVLKTHQLLTKRTWVHFLALKRTTLRARKLELGSNKSSLMNKSQSEINLISWTIHNQKQSLGSMTLSTHSLKLSNRRRLFPNQFCSQRRKLLLSYQRLKLLCSRASKKNDHRQLIEQGSLNKLSLIVLVLNNNPKDLRPQSRLIWTCLDLKSTIRYLKSGRIKRDPW